LDKYYRCPFSYYLDKVLKINVYEETFYQVIGTLFHAILQKYFDGKDSFEELWIQGKKEIGREFTAKEDFFLEKLRDELEFVIETLEYQETLTDLHDELHEEKIYTSINGNTNITFMGIVDKIKYKEVNDSTIVALIDYKTGTADIDLTMLPYGIGLQLPVYIYLARNNKKFKNVKVAGFYLQKIVNNESSNNDNKDYKEIRRKNLLLQGYSNADTSILYYMDNSYEDSNLIKSMKVKKDRDFSSYAKVLTEKEMDIIERIVVQKIEEGSKKICDADFAIAPKSIDNKNISCAFCKFGDVCYRKNEDIVNLKKLSQEEILGGDYDGMD
jgi:ATP-dependent helicase/DNAse subunit B